MKKRLDLILLEKGYVKSREDAKRLILSGNVLISGRIFDKVGMKIDEEAAIQIKEKFPYVSRGASKLKKAYTEFNLDFENKIVCDIGASTGGFTDFSLQHGAKKVYAIDVGYGQLDQKLRNDTRVVNMERTNIKDIDSWEKFQEATFDVKCHPEEGRRRISWDSSSATAGFGMTKKESVEKVQPIDIFVMDLSFISLKQVLPVVKQLVGSIQQLTSDTEGVILATSIKYRSPESKREGVDYGPNFAEASLDKQARMTQEEGSPLKTDIIALIKPQFEVGKKIADKCKGVVRDEKIQKEVVEEIKNFALDLGFEIKGVTESPILGAKGNKEFLIYLKP